MLGLGGITGTPQFMNTVRFFFAPDGTAPTADSVIGGYGDKDEASRCLGEMPERLVETSNTIDGPPQIRPNIPASGPGLPTADKCMNSACSALPCWNGVSMDLVACPDCQPECGHDLLSHPECMTSCLDQAGYNTAAMPNACKKALSENFIVDGEQDLGDAYEPDVAPLLAGAVPDPVDSFFPAVSPEYALAEPIDSVSMKVADGVYQPAVLNRLPLDPAFAGVKNADFTGGVYPEGSGMTAEAFLNLPLMPRPVFYANPKYVNANAPIFMMLQNFGLGPVSGPPGPPPNPTYNVQNECNTSETFSWLPLKVTNPTNCYSQPTSIVAADVDADGVQDLVTLHQRIYHRAFRNKAKFNACAGPGGTCFVAHPGWSVESCMEECLKDPNISYTPSWKDYLTNFDKSANHYTTPFDAAHDPTKSFSAIELKLYGVTLPYVPLGTPMDVHQQGYVTAYLNTNASAPWKADLFKRSEPGGNICRFGVGPVPTGLVADAAFDTHPGTDLVVSNFGEFDAEGVMSTGQFAAAGGITVVNNFDAKTCTAANIATYALNPGVSMNWSDPVNPVMIAKGDFNGDHHPDVAVTFFDSFLRSPVEIGQKDTYVFPDVVRADDKSAPSFFSPNIQCNWDPGTNPPGSSKSDCVDGGPPAMIIPNPAAAFPFTAHYFNTDQVNQVRCKRISIESNNPAHWGESGILGGPMKYDLFQCTGEANGGSCPKFDGHHDHVSKYVYRTDYRFDCDAMTHEIEYDGATPGLPPAWVSWGCTVSGGTLSCSGVPGFENWQCDVGRCTGASPKLDLTNCWGVTNDNSWKQVTGTAGGETKDLVEPPAGETWKLLSPVERDGVYQCGFNVAVNKSPEFAVYMNNPSSPGKFYNLKDPAVSNNYVSISSSAIDRIVPDITLPAPSSPKEAKCLNLIDCSCPGTDTSCDLAGATYTDADYKDHRMLRVREEKDPDSLPLSAWPYSIACADLVDKDGNDTPDGLDDCVVGFLNSHKLALFPSRGGLQPFTDTNMIVIDSTSPGYKDMLATMTTAAPSTPEEWADTIMSVFSGTNAVDIPQEPINAFNDIDGSAEKRRGITAVHGIPIKGIETLFNSVLGDEWINQNAVKWLDYELHP